MYVYDQFYDFLRLTTGRVVVSVQKDKSILYGLILCSDQRLNLVNKLKMFAIVREQWKKVVLVGTGERFKNRTLISRRKKRRFRRLCFSLRQTIYSTSTRLIIVVKHTK